MKYLGFALIVGGLFVAVFSERAIASQGPFRGCIDDFMEQECINVCSINKPNCSATAPPGCDPCKK